MDEYEYTVAVPSLYVAPNDDPGIVIGVSAHGGGTVGESYAHNGWSYAVEVNGATVITGDDLTSGAPATHAGMARTLANFLADAGESFAYRADESTYAGEYAGAARELLESEHERFAMFADDGSE